MDTALKVGRPAQDNLRSPADHRRAARRGGRYAGGEPRSGASRPCRLQCLRPGRRDGLVRSARRCLSHGDDAAGRERGQRLWLFLHALVLSAALRAATGAPWPSCPSAWRSWSSSPRRSPFTFSCCRRLAGRHVWPVLLATAPAVLIDARSGQERSADRRPSRPSPPSACCPAGR